MSGRLTSASAWIGIGIFSLAAGCNRGGLDLVPVEGLVTYQGAPLAKAGVLFTPGLGPSAMGSTDDEGKFVLKTTNREGALVGDYRVSIVKTKTLTIPAHPFPFTRTEYLIPAKYSSPQSSGLTATVVDDDNFFEFALTK